jgi:DNA-binding phage protein
MAKRSDNYKENYLYRSLLKPGEAAAYLSAAIEEAQETGDHDIFLLALKDVAMAYRVANVAKKTSPSPYFCRVSARSSAPR